VCRFGRSDRRSRPLDHDDRLIGSARMVFAGRGRNGRLDDYGDGGRDNHCGTRRNDSACRGLGDDGT
jgi:hypothetical protein